MIVGQQNGKHRRQLELLKGDQGGERDTKGNRRPIRARTLYLPARDALSGSASAVKPLIHERSVTPSP
jgi:hypothetical protein